MYDVNEEHLNELDTAFVWLRYIHAVVVPILIFAIHKVIAKIDCNTVPIHRYITPQKPSRCCAISSSEN